MSLATRIESLVVRVLIHHHQPLLPRIRACVDGGWPGCAGRAGLSRLNCLCRLSVCCLTRPAPGRIRRKYAALAASEEEVKHNQQNDDPEDPAATASPSTSGGTRASTPSKKTTQSAQTASAARRTRGIGTRTLPAPARVSRLAGFCTWPGCTCRLADRSLSL